MKLPNRRIALVATHDILMAALSFELAVAIRYYTYGAPQEVFYLAHGTVTFALVCGVVFWAMGLYRGIWHYASVADLGAIVRAVSLALLVFLPILFVLNRLEGLPRSAILITWPLLVGLLAGPRLLYRLIKDGNLSAVLEREDDRRVPVLLVGAGDQAETFIREMARSRLASYRPVGLLDDKPSRQGRDIRGVRVLGGLDDLEAVLARLTARGRAPQRVIITSGRLDGEAVRALFEACERAGLPLSRAPQVTDFHAGRVQVRPVDVEDLLGRPQRVLDHEAMARLVRGRRVLITGAGGTIGGELARQIAALEPAHVSLVENSEFALYTIDTALSDRHPELSVSAVIGDVRDRARVDTVFARERPDLVFHAAALKHVPLVEGNPNEGVLSNAMGARNVADACRSFAVSAMVLISTDKAVNPTNVMGASKRLAEMYCQGLSLSGASTRFVTVRFGNVLGSTGSVVLRFQDQIARGGPVTVTHPDMTRFFMTVREAVSLVLQAAASPQKGEAGKVYVLDMGAPVRILDLAEQMIRLAGHVPGRDIEIVHTGLRPGEKLYEELFHDSEPIEPTALPGIRQAAARTVDLEALEKQLDSLFAHARARETEAMLAELRALVPEYRPAGVRESAAVPQTAAQ